MKAFDREFLKPGHVLRDTCLTCWVIIGREAS